MNNTYTVSYHPPEYPAGCFPSRCRHKPEFVACANVEVPSRKSGRRHLEIDHSVCLACGQSLGATYGGNVLVDLQMLWDSLGFQPQMGARIIKLRTKWARIATYLFDENGWNGRHERIARMIDPRLTMKLKVEQIDHPYAIEAGHRIGTISFDPEYVRPVERAAA